MLLILKERFGSEMAITIKHGVSGKKYTFQVKGLNKVLSNLNNAIKEYKDRTLVGVSRAALFTRRKSLELTPEDTGNLKESCFVVWKGGTIGAGKSPNFVTGGERRATQKEVDELYRVHSKMLETAQGEYENMTEIFAAVYYSAWYALFVHEIKKKHKGSEQWKFLETAVKQNRAEILKIIADSVKSKGGGFTSKAKSF